MCGFVRVSLGLLSFLTPHITVVLADTKVSTLLSFVRTLKGSTVDWSMRCVMSLVP